MHYVQLYWSDMVHLYSESVGINIIFSNQTACNHSAGIMPEEEGSTVVMEFCNYDSIWICPDSSSLDYKYSLFTKY